MGWWSGDILGGDTPLDFLGDFASICECPMLDTDESAKSDTDAQDIYGYPFTRKQVEKFLDPLFLRAGKDKYSPEIGLQVLGYLVLFTGAEISKIQQDLLVVAGQSDEWANEDASRRKHVNAYIAAMREHKAGTSVNLKTKGLFEKLNERMSSGAPGLVNVHPKKQRS